MDPPRNFFGTLRQLGPGLIIAGSIVGSGELIATTKTGAQAGMALLWLIVIGCVIKVFVQIELGRHAITHGQTTLAALNLVPGRIGRANWILWFWLVMMAASIAQLGGIVGGVGQALALSFPLQGDYARAIQTPSASQLNQYLDWDETFLTAYDLHLMYDVTENNEPTSQSAELKEVSDWVETRQRGTIARLEKLSPAERAELGDMYRVAMVEDQASNPAAVEAHREKLRQRLTELNADSLQQEANRRVANKSFKESPSIERLRRIDRGHAVLAEMLVDVDRIVSREGGESTSLLVGQHRVRLAEGIAKEAKQKLLLEEELAAKQASTIPVVRIDALTMEIQKAEKLVALHKESVKSLTEPWTWDDKYWAAFATFITIALLVNGRYGIIQNLSTVLVVGFTFVTIGNVISLQTTPQWHVSAETFLRGLSFRLPETGNGLMMALATFGIIGVGATELITYPYWCIEKGYARHIGTRTEDEAWAARARGWMRVMHYDAFLSMVIYTVATIAFFIMGAAVLYSEGRDPDGMRMVSTLATAYVPVFGEYAKFLFLIGAVAVLYSTFLVANAGHSRMITDGIKVFGLMDPHNEKAHQWSISILCVLLPLICLAIFCTGINPVSAVAFAGLMQATMLPMIGYAALYLRRTASDPRISPPVWWDILLFLSFIGLLIVGAYGVWSKVMG
ncbi:MAG: Nramp family divalent metal transporter [Planctomycetaceae bacterium]